MNMTAFQIRKEGDKPLFARQCANKDKAKKEILNNGMLYAVDYVVYKNKRYSINKIYSW